MNHFDPVARRHSFAIISHPDAGKTTLTGKLLLFGGAIQLAGEVRAKRKTRSDWKRLSSETFDLANVLKLKHYLRNAAPPAFVFSDRSDWPLLRPCTPREEPTRHKRSLLTNP